jgi:membrane protease YdiL (CAAX protease family)
MLPEKPWKADAILRLFARVLICILMGALVGSAVAFFSEPQKANAVPFVAAVVVAFGLFAGGLFILAREWRLENFIRNFVILLVCLYAGFFLSWWAMHLSGGNAQLKNSVLKSVIGWLGFQGVALVLVQRFLREHEIDWTEAFGFKNRLGRAVLLGALALVAAYPVCRALQWVSMETMIHFKLQPQEQAAVQVLLATETLADRLVFGLVTVLLVPPVEEMLFRGILYPAVKQSGFPHAALWITSLLFAAIHFNLEAFVPLTFLALALTWLYERTGNLLAPIVMHVLFNAIGIAEFGIQKFYQTR